MVRPRSRDQEASAYTPTPLRQVPNSPPADHGDAGTRRERLGWRCDKSRQASTLVEHVLHVGVEGVLEDGGVDARL